MFQVNLQIFILLIVNVVHFYKAYIKSLPSVGLPPSTTHHLGPLPTTCLLPPVTHFLRPPLLLSHLLLPHAHHLEVSITLQELLHPHLLQGQKQHRQLQHGWMSKALTSGKFFKL